MKTIHPQIALADGAYRSPAESDLSRRSLAEAEDIRRLIAWELCGTMPPNDELLREIYADDVTLASFGAEDYELRGIAELIYARTSLAISPEETAGWKTVGDIIRFVLSKTS